MPWVDAERWERVNWAAHLNGIVVFALPNAFLMAAVLFAIAVLARNEIVSFVAALFCLQDMALPALFCRTFNMNKLRRCWIHLARALSA